jgi:hypothetical protein
LDGKDCDSIDLVRHIFLLAPHGFAQNHGARYCFLTGEPEDSAAVSTPDQLEIGQVLLIDVVGYSKLVRGKKQP